MRENPQDADLDSSQGQGAEQRDCQPPSEVIRVAQRAGRAHDYGIASLGVISGSGLQRVDIEVLEGSVNGRDDGRDREGAQHVPQCMLGARTGVATRQG